MINIPITKILFLDIETVGGCPDLESCERFSPEIAEQFEKYFEERVSKQSCVNHPIRLL